MTMNTQYEPQSEAEAAHMANYGRLFKTDPTTYTDEQLVEVMGEVFEGFRDNLNWMQESEAERGVVSGSAEDEARDYAFRLAVLHVEYTDRQERHEEQVEEDVQKLEDLGLVTRD